MRNLMHVITFVSLLLWFAGLLATITFLATAVKKEWLQIFVFSIVTLYPIIFGIIYYKKGWSFLLMSPNSFCFLTTIIPLIMFILLFYNIIVNRFRGVSDLGFSSNDNSVYFDGKKIVGADPKTFLKINLDYSKDQNHVYYHKKIIDGIDAASFEKFGENENCVRDKNGIYILKIRRLDPVISKIFEADRSTFILLEGRYAKDKNRVYYLGQPDLPYKIIVGADTESFVVTNHDNATDSEARDKSHYYLHGNLVEKK